MKTHNDVDWSRASSRSIHRPAILAGTTNIGHPKNSGSGFTASKPPAPTFARLALAGLLCLVGISPGTAVTLFDHTIPPTGFSDILANPNDHWSWDLNIIHYRFDPSFDTLFPGSAEPIKDQIRLALTQWSTASTTAYGTQDDYLRTNPALSPDDFVDIRSVTIHELGHVLGLGHPNMGAPLSLNFRKAAGGGVGPFTVQPNTGHEVMNGSVGSGWYNHILSWDELDAYNFVYTGRVLTFVEAAPTDLSAEIVFQRYHNTSTGNIARGAGAGTVRNAGVPLDGAVVTSATVNYNDNCIEPIGFRQHGFNWDMTASVDANSVVIRTRGTDNLTPIDVWYNQGPHQFNTRTHVAFGSNQKDDITHRWSNPTSDTPAGQLFHVGLVLDVWDWTVVNAVAFDAALNPSVVPVTMGHEWQNGVFASSDANPNYVDNDGLTMLPSGTNSIYARGFSIITSEAPLHRLSNLQIANVTGMGLSLSNLNRAQLTIFQTNGLMFAVTNFGIRTLGSSEEFVVVLQGDTNGLPENILTNGNYVILNRPDLVDKQLFTYWESANDESTVGNFGFIGEPPIASAPLPQLRIAMTNNLVLLAWPDPSTGYVLQQNPVLSTSSWITVSNTPNVLDGEKQVTLPPPGSGMFYRLKK